MELKPCPCCNGEAEIFHDTHSDYEEHWTWGVYCLSCGLNIECRLTEKEAVEDWNRRMYRKAITNFNVDDEIEWMNSIE